VSTSTSTAARYTHPGHNRLLDLLPADDRAALTPLLQVRAFRLTEIIQRRDRPITHVFFPTTCTCSVITQMDNGESVETGTIGHEGFVGLPLLLDAVSSPNEVICQGEGDAWAVRIADFQVALARAPALRPILNRYAQAYVVMLSQATACNRLHQINQRCAKWLLMMHDRAGSDTFAMTQEFLALMLGVRRPSVSTAAEALQAAGVISYHRGVITVLDRVGLEAASCECYRVTREEYDRLLPA
jgi:CRP-like cAMP-binding protein